MAIRRLLTPKYVGTTCVGLQEVSDGQLADIYDDLSYKVLDQTSQFRIQNGSADDITTFSAGTVVDNYATTDPGTRPAAFSTTSYPLRQVFGAVNYGTPARPIYHISGVTTTFLEIGQTTLSLKNYNASSIKSGMITIRYKNESATTWTVAKLTEFTIGDNPDGTSYITLSRAPFTTRKVVEIDEPDFEIEFDDTDLEDTIFRPIIKRWATSGTTTNVGTVRIESSNWIPPQTETWRKEGTFRDTYSGGTQREYEDFSVWRKLGPVSTGVKHAVAGLATAWSQGSVTKQGGYEEIRIGDELIDSFNSWAQTKGLGRIILSTDNPASTGEVWRELDSYDELKPDVVNVGYNQTFTRAIYNTPYTGTYAGSRDKGYVRQYTNQYVRTFAGSREHTYNREYSGTYTRSFTGYYSSTFSGDYAGTSSQAYARNFARNFTRYFLGNAYLRTRYSPNYLRAIYTRGYYARALYYARTYAGLRYENFATGYRRFTTNEYYSTNYAGSRTYYFLYAYYSPHYAGQYAAYYSTTYLGFYRTSSSATYNTNYATYYTGYFTGSYAGNRIKSYSRTRTESFSNFRAVGYVGTYTGSYAGSSYTGFSSATFTGTYSGTYTGYYNRQFARTFTGTFVSGVVQATNSTAATVKLWMRES